MEKKTLQQLKEMADQGTLCGVFEVDNRDYHAGPGIGSSQLRELDKSPWHYKKALEKADQEQTDAMRMGSLVDTIATDNALGGTKHFDAQFVVSTTQKRGKPDVKSGGWFDALVAAKAENKTPVSMGEVEKAREIATALLGHPTASLVCRGGSQASFYWTDPETKILCKCRPDFMPEGMFTICDLKTSSGGVTEKAMGDSAAKYGYHIQAAWYLWGVNQAIDQAGLEMDKPDRFMFCVVESKWPYEIAAYELGDQSKMRADSDIRRLLDLLNKCQLADTWPERNPGIIKLELPKWFLDRDPNNVWDGGENE